MTGKTPAGAAHRWGHAAPLQNPSSARGLSQADRRRGGWLTGWLVTSGERTAAFDRRATTDQVHLDAPLTAQRSRPCSGEEF